MGFSIQDYLKKINSTLTWHDCLALLLTTVVAVGWVTGLQYVRSADAIPVEIKVSEVSQVTQNIDPTTPFGSRNGTTFTYTWCSRSGAIKSKNRVYFQSEAEAIRSGRTLSKLCN